MYQAIYTNRIISAFLKNVPGTFVRDYLHNGGFLQVLRGGKVVRSWDSNETYAVPAQQLCYLAPGWTPRTTFVKGVVTKRPGWQVQMREAGKKLRPEEIKKIERDLGFPIFQQAKGT